MSTEVPPTLKVGDVVKCKGSEFTIDENSEGVFFWDDSRRMFGNESKTFWNPIHELLGVTPVNLQTYPNYASLEDLSKVLYHLTEAPAPTVKPKRAPRRKDGIPESTYRGRARKDALVRAESQIISLMQEAESQKQLLAEGAKLLDASLSMVSGLEAVIHDLTEDRDGLIGHLAEVHLENKTLVETSIQTRNENAQARRDAWSATYKMETLLAQPWIKFFSRILTKRKG